MSLQTSFGITTSGDRTVARWLLLLCAMVFAMVVLGISTLLLAVPVALGAAHQAVAMLLFTIALYLVHALRRV